ncbi:MAG: isoprenylcysteine carboxylmethyltransferase family protein [Hyphomicrobiaceae bacterium]|nr:MAG: isoprenylcysteine carboxylmethyltransferase family protein [Hyphomicrobiaceae bacterium]
MVVSRIKPSDGQDLQRLQRRRKLVLRVGVALCCVVLLITQSAWRVSNPLVYDLIHRTGLALIVVCILGRTWCTLYIGGSKKRQLVTLGPYSVVRNPLYMFTIIGAAGIGAQAGSLSMTLLLAALVTAIFSVVTRQEEQFLAATFRDEFTAYAARVPRLLPRPTLWREADELLVRPHLVRRTFLDACLFLLAVPVSDVIDWLQQVQWLPVLFHLR